MSSESGGYSLGSILFWGFILSTCVFSGNDDDKVVVQEALNNDTVQEESSAGIKENIEAIEEEAKKITAKLKITITNKLEEIEKEGKENEQNNIDEEAEEEIAGKEEIQIDGNTEEEVKKEEETFGGMKKL